MSLRCFVFCAGNHAGRLGFSGSVLLAGLLAAVAVAAVPRDAYATRKADGGNLHAAQKQQAKRIKIANNNPISAFFSLFTKKKKPARVIVVPRKIIPSTRQPNAGRIFNPYLPNHEDSGRTANQSERFNIGRRTMCVRLCDGYYWPMRKDGSNSSLVRDSQKCEAQCKSPSRMFILHSSTDNIATMRDMSGKPYGKLPNAFKYRTSYNPSCRCRAEPWSEHAELRHKQYAAVGRERRVLAIRAVTLDLRKTFAAAPEKYGTETDRGTGWYWNPQVPSRKPAVTLAMGPGPVALSRAEPLRPVKRDNPVRRLGARIGRTSRPTHYRAGILGFDTFGSARRTPMSFLPTKSSSAQSRRPEVQSLLRPSKNDSVLKLRKGLN